MSDLPKLCLAAEALGLSQTELSKRAQVSQGQVSRILAGSIQRPSKGFQRLCTYVFSQASGTESLLNAGHPLPESIERAIRAVWDGSTEDAIALAEVIQSLSRLRPPSSGDHTKWA